MHLWGGSTQVCPTLTQSRKIKRWLVNPRTGHPLGRGKALVGSQARELVQFLPLPHLRRSLRGKQCGPRLLVASLKDREHLLQAVPSGSKFHFRSQHLKPFFFLIYVSCGKSEEKLVEHLSSLHLEGRKYAPSLLRKHCKPWCFHKPNIGWFSKPPAWLRGPVRGEERDAATWDDEVCFGSRAWNL